MTFFILILFVLFVWTIAGYLVLMMIGDPERTLLTWTDTCSAGAFLMAFFFWPVTIWLWYQHTQWFIKRDR